MARRTFAALALLALLVGLAAPVEASPTEASDPDVIPGSWIVTLVDGSDPAREGPALARQYGGEAGHIYDVVLGGFQFLGSDRAAANMSRNPRVQRVEADRVLRLFSETVPTGVSRIRAAHADSTVDTSLSLDPSATGAGVSIAILDTGIETTHDDLSANIVRSNGNVVGVSCIDGEGFEDDGNGHGTHVAGTAAAVAANGTGVVGVASEAGLIPVKVLSKSGSGSWSSVACGVNWVTNNVAAHGIAVANMSLGGSGSAGDGCSSSALRQVICDSVAAGVAYSVAAGNSGDDASKFVPAAYPEVITVSAFADYDGEPGSNGTCYRFVGPGGGIECDDGLATFTNYGEIVDVTAPGRWIYSSDKGNGYSEKSGTSMAAPHVAGVAALVKALHADATPDDLRAHLQATGECPELEVNGNTGNCDSTRGAWYNDADDFTEPLVNALWAATTALVKAPSTSDPDPEPDTGTLTGKVTDTDSTAIEGATVAIEGTSLSATTDINGDYTITDVPVGDHTATASAPDYESLSKQVKINADATTTQDFALSPPSTDEPDPTGFTLTATGDKVRGLQKADLVWNGNSGNVDIFRDGTAIETDVSGSTYTDHINERGGGSYTYKVCETGTVGTETESCSNEATVTF